MLPKITLENFRLIKKRLSDEFKNIEKNIEKIDTSNITKSEEEALTINLLETYNLIQRELFNYDLSDIPFESGKK